MITKNLPAANRTVAGVDLLIGDGGREAAGHYPENVEDCVARSLAFALNDGADDGGLALLCCVATGDAVQQRGGNRRLQAADARLPEGLSGLRFPV